MSTATAVQADRPMTVTTPLGPDALLLIGLAGQEGISQLFHFQLSLLAKNQKIVPFEKLLGQGVTAQLSLPGGKKRFFNGICNRVSQGESDTAFAGYRLDVVPQFWLWTKRVQSRIFQHLSVPDILKRVLNGLDVAYELQGAFHPRDYCVQYRETDFHFASRLMEEEGFYYFFKHTDTGHQMVVANTPRSHPEMPDDAKVIYQDIRGGRGDHDRVIDWEKTQELRSGKYTLWDHSFELPHKHLEGQKTILDSVQVGSVAHKLTVGGNDELEIYDYPGEFAQRFDGIDPGGGERSGDLKKVFEDNKRTAEIRMQQEAMPSLVIQGAGKCRRFVPGHRFTLVTKTRSRENGLNADGEYLLTSVTHSAHCSAGYRSGGRGFDYRNSFLCIPFGLPYRPLRLTPKPVVQGTQTAIVVGPEKEEVFTDKYGRVKIQFHWDREGKNDSDSSCWVRVTQPWAGKRWGTSFWPRIGQEVVVDFLEGDPDCPIIVGTVYNADQMPPYLGNGPDAKHGNDNKVSGIKTNSTPGGKGFNELRFDDTQGKEQVFIHAERNMDVRVKNDGMERVLGNRHLIVGWEKDGKKGGDHHEMVYQDTHLHVHRDQIEHIDGNQALLVGKGKAENGGNVDVVIEKTRKGLIGEEDHLHVKKDRFQLVDGGQSLTVGGDQKVTIAGKSHVHVKADRNEKVDGVQSLTVGGNQQEKVGGNHALEAAQEIHLKAGMKVIIEAGAQLSLKGPGGFVDIGPAGVTIQGTLVLINSGGAAGSGSGSKPTAPEDAAAPQDAVDAMPLDPAVADDSKSGQKSAPDSWSSLR